MFAYNIIFIGQGCLDGRIRLVGASKETNSGMVSVSGRVQLCVGAQWTDICFSDSRGIIRWNYQDQLVACRQLRNENSCKLEAKCRYPSGITSWHVHCSSSC